ncbi:MAG: FAD-binding protein [Adlercreutzia mucosicola]|uniref:FAD-binding protein n=1 Tax=Adlercreutzia mucosicola TaxID=580026 RepID=A0A6N8JNE2_9ACTN|nr:FAD-dependent oxidoreductase [Adlercreutzia mucosicola]MCI9495733.1 FAD-binding protein [Adlercreutzia mucosicola]MVX60346.1 FAD-binding protein [Adlercreutzia mucosicola]
MKDFGKKGTLSRRSFLAALGLAGASAAGAGLAGCAPKQPTEAAGDDQTALADTGTLVETDIPEDKIIETVDCDVCVVGLGVAGVGALRSAAEGGLKVVGVEKGSKPSARSNMFAAFGTEKTRSIGIEDISPTEVANELMTQMSHRADYRITTKWLKNCGEAFEWYTSAYDGLLWLGMEDELPEDPSQLFVCADTLTSGIYRFGIDHERLFAGCCCISGGDETHTPILQANVDAAVATGNAQVQFYSPAVKLETADGQITAVICRNDEGEGYTRYRVSKGVVLATGGYSHNEKMLGQYAPWILKNQDKFLFSYEVTDHDGNPADTGDGQQMGMNVGGHLDVGPHAVMAHILQFGQEFFLQVNEHGERFTNEDLSMTNIAKVMQNQPGSKVFQIIDSHWPEQYPMLDVIMANIRSYGDGEGFSAQADTLEELASQLELSADATQNLTAAVARYNELCEKGVDEDFGKAAEKMFPVVDPPFYAITYDMLKHTSVEDVSCMRLLVTMGGLVTDDNARVLNDDMEPIPGLFAVGNVQGGRFVEDYPFTLSGASHAAALTYGYLTGKYLAGQA